MLDDMLIFPWNKETQFIVEESCKSICLGNLNQFDHVTLFSPCCWRYTRVEIIPRSSASQCVASPIQVSGDSKASLWCTKRIGNIFEEDPHGPYASQYEAYGSMSLKRKIKTAKQVDDGLCKQPYLWVLDFAPLASGILPKVATTIRKWRWTLFGSSVFWMSTLPLLFTSLNLLCLLW